MSLAELRQHFGVSRDTMAEWLWDVPVPEWTRRPNAKDDLREKALALRRDGRTVPHIAEALGVSRSTAYLWVRHLPLDATIERAHERRSEHSKRVAEARWEPLRKARDAERDAVRAEAAALVGDLSRRDLLLLGAVAYWCEGAKEKPWRPTSMNLQFINSDEVLIRLFLRFVEALGVSRRSLRYRVSIHESADAAAATRSWAEVVGVPAEHFQRATLKSHNPSTVRHNVGDSYRGCLTIYVPKSVKLYWIVEGVMQGIARSEPAAGER
jgi:hypothetical protein